MNTFEERRRRRRRRGAKSNVIRDARGRWRKRRR